MPVGGEKLKARYHEAGVETVEVEVRELIKAGGGIHCMTAFLRREEP
jgi:arginine deiminase